MCQLIVDFSTKHERNYQTPVINENPVERVDSFRYLSVHITQDLSWSCHINTVVKKARQRLYHLRRLRDFRLPSKVLRNFHSCTIESILTRNIATWFGNSTMQNRRALQRVVQSAERIIRTKVPDLHSIYNKRCWTKARKIVKDLSHPNNGLCSLFSYLSNQPLHHCHLPPPGPLGDFMEGMDTLLSVFPSDTTPLTVLGDFNLPSDKLHSSGLLALLNSFSLSFNSCPPTHKEGNVLDLVFTHPSPATDMTATPLHISDHHLLSFLSCLNVTPSTSFSPAEISTLSLLPL
ncbi:hypothetical protein QTP70_001161 [Hemibagrus guttatus]|uniref:Alkylated DNA repair protein AlkB homologue 8 N-terminal domain-containing protein n=1 Tax=Hemibagrus guttatus TaxID=175788 RepID=A0AAE0QJW9_9TELE|nr:hypothetical protein QTP70_001161 [Hemibagrus guttatus]